MNNQYNYLVIDDDPISNAMVNIILKNYLKPSGVQLFTNPVAGLECIKNSCLNENTDKSTIVLLDINMPIMSGWDFLFEFEKLNKEIRDQFTIFILSSSIDDKDMERAKMIKSVH